MTCLVPMDAAPSVYRSQAAPMPALNRLERAGWAVVAGEVLGLFHGEAGLLRELVFNAGRVVSNEELAKCFLRHEHRQPERPPSARVAVRMARVRRILPDLGVPRHAIENEPGVGYAMAPHHARRIRQIVEGQ